MLLQTPDVPAIVAAGFVRDSISRPELRSPVVGLILGSGLNPAGDDLLNRGGVAIEYSAIPGMPHPHVVGHAGRLVLGMIHEIPVAILQGRVHSYEGHSTPDILFGIRLLSQLGICGLVVTNAAGGIRKSLVPGSLMLISGHLRPLISGVPDFSVIADAARDCGSTWRDQLWNSTLRRLAMNIPTDLSVQEGVYSMMPGPCYETPAEIRMLRQLGADAVGMSTVPEAIFAASKGIDVIGISCITNVAAGLSDKTLSHTEVTTAAASIATGFVSWLSDLVRQIAPN